MAITDKEEGVWELEQVYNKINQGGIWSYNAPIQLDLWGANHAGGIGQNTTSPTDYSSPTQIPGTTWSKFGLSKAYSSGVGVKTNGTLWTWGGPGYLLAQNNNVQYSSPTQVGTDTTWSEPRGGWKHQACFKTDGSLWVWGDNSGGCLGQNQQGYPTVRYSSPIQISGTWSTSFQQFSAGTSATGGVKSDGTLWMWGHNGNGTLGLNAPTNAFKSSPTQVGTDTTWDKIEVGGYQCYGIKTNGTLWSWGYNNGGQLGLNEVGSPTIKSSPTQVGTDTTWASVFNSFSSTVGATKTDGTLWMWGNGPYGSLVANLTGYRSSPVQVGTDTNWRIDDYMGASPAHSLASKTDGTLWGWGWNKRGALGLNAPTNASYSSPIQIPGEWQNPQIGGQNQPNTAISGALRVT